jgi:hypothetical protein
MKATIEFTAEQETQAQELAARITEVVADDRLRVARLLISKDTRHALGQTGLQLRGLVQRISSKNLEASLATNYRVET